MFIPVIVFLSFLFLFASVCFSSSTYHSMVFVSEHNGIFFIGEAICSQLSIAKIVKLVIYSPVLMTVDLK